MRSPQCLRRGPQRGKFVLPKWTAENPPTALRNLALLARLEVQNVNSCDTIEWYVVGYDACIVPQNVYRSGLMRITGTG